MTAEEWAVDLLGPIGAAVTLRHIEETCMAAEIACFYAGQRAPLPAGVEGADDAA